MVGYCQIFWPWPCHPRPWDWARNLGLVVKIYDFLQTTTNHFKGYHTAVFISSPSVDNCLRHSLLYDDTINVILCLWVMFLPRGRRGIVIERFLSLFLCQQHYEKTAGPICTKFSGKVWSDHWTTWLNFGSMRVNGLAGRRSSYLLFGLIVVFWQSCAAT